MNEYQRGFRDRHMVMFPLFVTLSPPRSFGSALFRRRRMWSSHVERLNHHTRIVCIQRGMR